MSPANVTMPDGVFSFFSSCPAARVKGRICQHYYKLKTFQIKLCSSAMHGDDSFIAVYLNVTRLMLFDNNNNMKHCCFLNETALTSSLSSLSAVLGRCRGISSSPSLSMSPSKASSFLDTASSTSSSVVKRIVCKHGPAGFIAWLSISIKF